MIQNGLSQNNKDNISRLKNNDISKYKPYIPHVTYEQKLSGLKQFVSSGDILRWIIIVAGVILAAVIGITVATYTIKENWKIAITTFILLLPFSLFLQASLNVNAIKSERQREIQDALRKKYVQYYELNKHTLPSDLNLSDLSIFKREIEKRSIFLLKDIRLYVIYQEAYQIYLTLDEHEQSKYRDRLLQFELGELLTSIVRIKLREEGINFGSYLLPLYFFLFMYFAGFLITLPLISSIFTHQTTDAFIPLYIKSGYDSVAFTTNSEAAGPIYGIPLTVIQWGFLGGLVYTSISLLNRFLRKDLTPRVYFNAAFRLILSSVVAIVIYFLYISTKGNNAVPNEIQPYILLLAFLAGVAPIQFLINFADTILSKINKGWKHRSTAGNRSIRQLDGINSVTAERLSEEGIDYIQQIALCNPIKLAERTNFPLDIIRDWKDQAILFVLTGDVIVGQQNAVEVTRKGSNTDKGFINTILDKNLGIRTISSFIDIWNDITSKDDENAQKSFFKSLGLLDADEKNFIQLKYLFQNIASQGKLMSTTSEDKDLYTINKDIERK